MTQYSRRRFLKTSGALAGGYLLGVSPSPARTRWAVEKLEIGIVGTANRAGANLQGVSGEAILGLCDVDETYLGKAKERFPAAQTFVDFRQMLDNNKFDAVVVSTADHTHAPATMRALRAGSDVYCEKPLTHSVWEARQIARAAQAGKRVTQMGTQIHAGGNYRRVVELIQSGVLGQITEAHSWVGKAWGGGERPQGDEVSPTSFHHDLWLGPAPKRPYHSFYHPAQWRRFWDFGGGTLGDMGCHHLDLPYWALQLRHPVQVSAAGPPVSPETTPTHMSAHWKFPPRTAADGRKLSGVDLHWHDGGNLPPQFSEPELAIPKWGSGTLFVGENGMLLCDYGKHLLLNTKDGHDYSAPPESIPPSIGHYQEWLQAIRKRGSTTCNFDYSGALTETVLLGNIAYRTGATFAWDGAHLKADLPAAQALVQREYRKGWSL
jgi:predicted dehydrogenase